MKDALALGDAIAERGDGVPLAHPRARGDRPAPRSGAIIPVAVAAVVSYPFERARAVPENLGPQVQRGSHHAYCAFSAADLSRDGEHRHHAVDETSKESRLVRRSMHLLQKVDGALRIGHERERRSRRRERHICAASFHAPGCFPPVALQGCSPKNDLPEVWAVDSMTPSQRPRLEGRASNHRPRRPSSSLILRQQRWRPHRRAARRRLHSRWIRS